MLANWKTTANGFLAAIIGAAGPLTAYLATVNNPKAATAAGIVTLVATIARVWIGMIQTDAPTVPAAPAGPVSVPTKAALVLFAICVALPLAGCKPVTATLPPGALNTFDASSYESLMVAQATLNALKVQAPAIEQSVPQFKGVLNQAINDYDIAETAWQAYHATGANANGVTVALTTLATDILKVQGLIPTGGTQ
jgi:cytochrome b561